NFARLTNVALARFGLGLRGLSGERLIHLDVRQLQFAEQIEQNVVLLGREIAFGLFMERIEHINQFAGGVGVYHRLAGARVGVSAKDLGGVAADHANQIFESWRALRRFRRWQFWNFGVG